MIGKLSIQNKQSRMDQVEVVCTKRKDSISKTCEDFLKITIKAIKISWYNISTELETLNGKSYKDLILPTILVF